MSNASYFADSSEPTASSFSTGPPASSPYSTTSTYNTCSTSVYQPIPQQPPYFPPPPTQSDTWTDPGSHSSPYLQPPPYFGTAQYTPQSSPTPQYVAPALSPSWQPAVAPPSPSYTPESARASCQTPWSTQTRQVNTAVVYQDHSHSTSGQRPLPLTECPSAKGPEGIMFATYWYRFKGCTDFAVCTRCYEDKLANTPFTNWLETFHYNPPPSGEISCDFNNERVRQLLERALQTGNINELYAYVQRRDKLGLCPSTQGCTGDNAIQWYRTADLPGLAICGACYEECVLASPFAHLFGSSSAQLAPGNVQACMLARHFARRTFTQCAQTNDWNNFTGWIRYAGTVPSCPGSEEVDAASRNWFKPTGLDGMRICESCHLDYICNTPVASSFHQVQQKWHQNPRTSCSFAQISVQIASAQLIEKDFPRWFQLLSRMTTASPCGEIQDGTFYTFDNPYTAGQVEFKICERCYLGYCVSTGLESRFAKVSVPGLAKCDFHPTAPQFAKYIGKYCEMVLTNNPNVLIEYACKMELVPPCPGSETIEMRQWWGTDQFNFCAECYEDFGKDTVFERGFRWRGNLIKDQKCDMHSQNMRRRYWEACQKQDLMEFNEYCRAREQIYRELMQARTNVQQAQTHTQTVTTQPQPAQPRNTAQSLTARLSQQHSFRMNMMNLINAQNGRFNAAMSGLMTQGSSYNSWYDSGYQSYQTQYDAAQQGVVMSAFGSGGGGGHPQNNETADVQSALGMLAVLEERWKEVE